MRFPPDLCTGVYRHWKGGLYLVLGYAEKASRNEAHSELSVVYINLAPDEGKPVMFYREASEFFDYVNGRGEVPSEEMERASQGSVRFLRSHGFMPRFEHVHNTKAEYIDE